jgi:hypothetical protein
MSHEQSETIQDPTTRRWFNVYGKEPAQGLTLPLEPGVTYPDTASAVEAAKIRSQMHVPHDEMRLSELVLSPEELEALARRLPPTDVYTGSLVAPTLPTASPGMRILPGNTKGSPTVYPDREAPPKRNRPSLYGRPR